MRKRSRLFRALLAIDNFFNVLLLNGSEDHTISGHVGYMSLTTNKRRWRILERIINAIFWFDKNHCYKSIEWDEVG